MRATAGALVLALLAAGPMAAQRPPYAIYRDTSTANPPADSDGVADAGEPPVLRTCGRPSTPVGTLLGSGWVTYTVTSGGHMDPSTLQVESVERISEAGLLSAARRLLGNCRYRAARQAGKPVPVVVRHRVSFQTGSLVSIAEVDGEFLPVEEMPAVGRCEGFAHIFVRGSIQLSFVIGLDGWAEPESIDILESSSSTLTRAATALARRCRYAPARSHGEPVRARVTQRFTFRRSG